MQLWERRSRPFARVAAATFASLALLSAPASVVVDAVHGASAGSDAASRRLEAARDRSSASYGRASVEAAGSAAGDSVIAPPPAEFDAPALPPAPPPAALRARTAGLAGGTWAVVIGIDDYPGSRSDLRASVADANEVDTALGRYGVPPERRLVLRNRQATAATIADSMRWLVARASADATVVFFYAGHVRKLNSRTEAMVGADGRIVTDASMASLLAPLAARKVWIAMAACYGGGFTEALAPGRILTGAADANSLAYENSAFGHSYLVEYMVRRAMNQGQAPGSVEQSFAWAVDALRREYPNRIPVQTDQLPGELSLGTPPPRVAAPPPAPPSGGGSGGGGGGSSPQPGPGKDPNGKDQCIVTFGSLIGC